MRLTKKGVIPRLMRDLTSKYRQEIPNQGPVCRYFFVSFFIKRPFWTASDAGVVQRLMT